MTLTHIFLSAVLSCYSCKEQKYFFYKRLLIKLKMWQSKNISFNNSETDEHGNIMKNNPITLLMGLKLNNFAIFKKVGQYFFSLTFVSVWKVSHSLM